MLDMTKENKEFDMVMQETQSCHNKNSSEDIRLISRRNAAIILHHTGQANP